MWSDQRLSFLRGILYACKTLFVTQSSLGGPWHLLHSIGRCNICLAWPVSVAPIPHLGSLSTIRLRTLLRLRRILAHRGFQIAAFASLLLATAAYQVLKGVGPHASPGLSLAFQVLVLACYGVLWLLLESVFCRDRPTPIQAFWHLLVGAAVYLVVYAAAITAITGGFNEDGQPIAISTAFQSVLTAPVLAAFSILLLLRLRGLILQRRTRATVRTWRLMVGGIVLAAAVEAVASAYPEATILPPIKITLGVGLVALAAINVFRVSWVVRLTATQKAWTILMAIGLMVFCFFAGLSSAGAEWLLSRPSGSPQALLEFHSAGLGQFVNFVCQFTFAYCLTSILSLTFHLPTTGDFRRREGEMEAIYSLTDLVREVFDREQLVHTIVRSAAEAQSANMAWLVMANPYPRVVAGHNVAPEASQELVNCNEFWKDAGAAREPLNLDRALLDPRVTADARAGIESLLVVPIAAHRKKVLGMLFLAKDVDAGFVADDVRTARAFAAQAALALDNARMLEELVEKERLTRELDIAREVQGRLLPQKLPALDRIDVAATSQPAYEVGGDYHDFVALDGDRLAFIVSDVSGKGTSAAFYMAGMQGIFRSVARIAPDPLDFLTHANLVLYESLERSVYITVIYGIIDHRRQAITLARAGHCPAVIAHQGSPARFLRSRGLGVGLDRSSRFRKSIEVETFDMGPGDSLVFYTDGLVESRNGDGEEYGFDRLLACVEASRHLGAEDIQASLLDDLQHFIGSQRRYDDDLTLLILKWRHGGGQAALV